MTHYKQISIEDLEVNPANDRHGDLGSEMAAIEWLLVNKTEKMKDLLQNIAQKAAIFDEPLVCKVGDKYRVYDGNRRVTCLKLLHNLVNDNINNPLSKRVADLKKAYENLPSPYVECRIEENIDIINDILELRHIPGNSGAGQLKWDGHEKENFLERTGKTQKINFAREVNQLLIDNAYLNDSDRIPLSTFNRLFSSPKMRKRVGVEIHGNEIRLLNDMDASYQAMTRIAKDMIAGEKTLDDVWDNGKKTKYLDDLEKEGVLPRSKDAIKTPKTVKDTTSKGIKPAKGGLKRIHLLPTNLPTPNQNKFFSNKFCHLFYELQNTLRIKSHCVSISIAFRTFLEILTVSYIEACGLDSSGNLATKIERVFSNMQKHQKMPEEAKAFIKKIGNDKEYFSVNTLHKVVHNDMQISESDLFSYVNNLDGYLREAIIVVNEKGK